MVSEYFRQSSKVHARLQKSTLWKIRSIEVAKKYFQ